MTDLDPAYGWIEVTDLSSQRPQYIQGRCRHLRVVPVESAGQVVARLCLTCDAQLPGLLDRG